MNERNSGEWASAQRLRLAPSQSPLSRAGRPGRHPAALPPAGSAGGRPRSRAAGGAGSRPPAVPLRGAVEERAAFPPPEPRDAPHPTRSPRVSSGSGLRASSAAAHLLAGTSLAGHGGLKQGWGATAPQQIKTPFKSAPSRRRHCGQLLGRGRLPGDVPGTYSPQEPLHCRALPRAWRAHLTQLLGFSSCKGFWKKLATQTVALGQRSMGLSSCILAPEVVC